MFAPGVPARSSRVLLGVLFAAGAACAPAKTPPREAVVRFLSEPAEELFDPAGLVRTDEVESWELRHPAEAQRWSTEPGVLRNANHGGFTLAGESPHLALERSVDLAADRVQVVALTHRQMPAALLHLEWAAPGEPFAPERRLSVRSLAIPVGAVPTTRFAVGDHPLWRGTVGRLRLSFDLIQGTHVVLRRLSALTVTADPAAVARALSHPWLVRLGNDTRSALLAPPGTAIERETTVPPGASFETAFGRAGAGGEAFAFRVVFVDPRSGPQTLFRGEARAGATGAWIPVRADLGRLAGRRGLLRLEAGTDRSPDAVPLAAWGHPEILAPAAEGSSRLPNVVLVSIDTLRADRLSLYGNPRPTSPNLDAWARRRAVVFDTAVAAAPWTLPAHTSMFTGLEAYRHGVNYDFAAPMALTTLAERLHAAGYRTGAVTGGGLLSPRFGLAQGFDTFFHYQPAGAGDDGDLAEVTRRTLAALAEGRNRPFFLFVHTYEVHGPYLPRQPHFRRFRGRPAPSLVGPTGNALVADDGFASRATLQPLPLAPGGPSPPDLSPETLSTLARDLYDAGIAYTDDRLGRIFDALDDLGLAPHTAVVVTSDHGEMLGEHGLAGHAYLYDENLLVPLVVAAPDGRGAGTRVARQVGHVDLAPTILELAGLPLPEGLDGRSLVPLLGDPTAFDGDGPAEAWAYAPRTNHGAALRIGGRLKVVLRTAPWPPTRGRAQLFDLGRDPGEHHPIAEAEPAARRRIADELAAAYAGLALSVANAGPETLHADLRGEALSVGNLHSLDLDCDCLRMQGAFRAILEVPAGERFTLRLEEPAGTALTVRARIGERGRGRSAIQRFDLAALTHPGALAWDGVAWRRDSPDPGTEVPIGFVLAWGRGGPREARRADEGDEALRDQLRALGYLD